jgi:hypothetical protein
MRVIAALLSTLLVASPVFAADAKQDRVADKLMIGGATVFTVAYAPMTVTGTVFSILSWGDAYWGARTFTPIGGPFLLAAGLNNSAGNGNGGLIALAAFDGILQIGGIALMIAGGVRQHRANSRP